MSLPVGTAPTVRYAEGANYMLAAWHVAGKPFAIVGGSNAMQQLQLRRLAASSADGAAVFGAEAAARDWLRARMG